MSLLPLRAAAAAPAAGLAGPAGSGPASAAPVLPALASLRAAALLPAPGSPRAAALLPAPGSPRAAALLPIPAAAAPLVSSHAVEPGGAVVVTVADRPPWPGAVPHLAFGERQPPFRRLGGRWVALVPISYWTPPGRYTLDFSWRHGATVLVEVRINLAVVPKPFPTQHLRVSTTLASRRSEDRLAADAERTARARSHSWPRPLWTQRFGLPLSGRRTTEFGQVRLINGQPVGRHSGLDLAAPEGTPVLSANSGRVVLAGWLHVTGGTVIVDHGLGLFLTYAHLSTIEVREGQWIDKGEVVGRVGATGFATGPHLHWGAWLDGVWINPEDLVRGPLAEALLRMRLSAGVNSRGISLR